MNYVHGVAVLTQPPKRRLGIIDHDAAGLSIERCSLGSADTNRDRTMQIELDVADEEGFRREFNRFAATPAGRAVTRNSPAPRQTAKPEPRARPATPPRRVMDRAAFRRIADQLRAGRAAIERNGLNRWEPPAMTEEYKAELRAKGEAARRTFLANQAAGELARSVEKEAFYRFASENRITDLAEAERRYNAK